MEDFFNLQDPNYAYLLGLFQTDGSLSKASRNRGKFQIELVDTPNMQIFFNKIATLIPYNSTISYRTRDTNFKKIILLYYFESVV